METNVERRESWSSRFGTLMAIAGMSVGLGNIWRFPYMVGAYGGGAFIFAYLIVSILIVMPLAIVEAGLGKSIQGGNIDAWEKILKSRKGGSVVGGLFSFSYAAENFFYMFVMGSLVYFMYVFISGMTNVMAPEIIYSNMETNMTGIMVCIVVVMTLMVAFAIYLGIVKGIESICKIIVPAIAVIFVIIAIVEVFLIDGIAEGYNYYLNPDWNALKSFSIWKDALGQALLSVGVGPGCVLVYGSHIKKKNDVVLSMATVCMIDTTMALVAGFAIIPACVAMGLDPESGSGLIFIVLPKVLSALPFGNVIGLFVMIAAFFAAFSSAIAQMEVAVSSFSDAYKWKRSAVTFVVAGITLVMAIICTINKAQFDFWNSFVGNYTFIATAGIGAIGYIYIYGVKKIKTESIDVGADIHLGDWFIPLVKFVAGPLMIIIMSDCMYPWLTKLLG